MSRKIGRHYTYVRCTVCDAIFSHCKYCKERREWICEHGADLGIEKILAALGKFVWKIKISFAERGKILKIDRRFRSCLVICRNREGELPLHCNPFVIKEEAHKVEGSSKSFATTAVCMQQLSCFFLNLDSIMTSVKGIRGQGGGKGGYP